MTRSLTLAVTVDGVDLDAAHRGNQIDRNGLVGRDEVVVEHLHLRPARRVEPVEVRDEVSLHVDLSVVDRVAPSGTFTCHRLRSPSP